jgi:hypothetical protein
MQAAFVDVGDIIKRAIFLRLAGAERCWNGGSTVQCRELLARKRRRKGTAFNGKQPTAVTMDEQRLQKIR